MPDVHAPFKRGIKQALVPSVLREPNFCCAPAPLDGDALDLVERSLIARAVVETGRPRQLVRSDGRDRHGVEEPWRVHRAADAALK